MPPLPIVAADAEPPVLLEIRRPAAPTGGGVRRPTEELPAYDLTSASPGISRLKLSLLYVLLIAIAIILGIAIASSL
jgi:hypothetical protein